MLDRAHGKAKQSVDMNVQNNTVNDGEFTPAQLDALEKIVGNGSSDACHYRGSQGVWVYSDHGKRCLFAAQVQTRTNTNPLRRQRVGQVRL